VGARFSRLTPPEGGTHNTFEVVERSIRLERS